VSLNWQQIGKILRKCPLCEWKYCKKFTGGSYLFEPHMQ